MSATTRIDVRASSLKDCVRKSVYGASGAPEREWTEREQRILYRGRRLGGDYADWLERQHGPDNVARELEIPWRFGTGHADIFLQHTRTLIEVVSSAHASDVMIHRKLLQLVLYLEHFEAADAGMLVILDPADFAEERYPVARGTDTYKGLAAEVAERIESIARWRDTGQLPDRECRKPSDAIGRWCRHAETCFDGWEPDPVEAIDTPEAREVATAYYQAKQAEKGARSILTTAESERKEIEQKLAELVPVGKRRIGPLEITRTHVERKPTIDTRKVELAGVPIAPDFYKPGATYDTFRVDRVTDDPLVTMDDFGEEAPF